MAYICINYAGVLEANQILKKAVRELRELEDMCLFLSKTVAPEIQAQRQIGTLSNSRHGVGDSRIRLGRVPKHGGEADAACFGR